MLAAATLDSDPSNRRMDRMMACLGVLDDAAPLFEDAQAVRGGGVLLAVPLILQSGALQAARRTYGKLGPSFYGLRTTVMSLLVMALLRIKRPEALKEHPPKPLGKILGLDRFVEVKTLRRQLSAMAARKRARKLMEALARRRIAERQNQIGFLYVDGHVREYHGKGKLAKAYVTRRRLAAKGTTDTWVHDAAGEPLFLVTCDLNEQLSQMLPPASGRLSMRYFPLICLGKSTPPLTSTWETYPSRSTTWKSCVRARPSRRPWSPSAT